jgi:hypothetical protein
MPRLTPISLFANSVHQATDGVDDDLRLVIMNHMIALLGQDQNAVSRESRQAPLAFAPIFFGNIERSRKRLAMSDDGDR